MVKSMEQESFDTHKILYNESVETDIIELKKGGIFSGEADYPTLILVTKGIIELKYVFDDSFTKYLRISDDEAFYFKKGSSFQVKGISKSKIIKIRILG